MHPFKDFIINNPKGLYIDIGAGTPKEYNYSSILYNKGYRGLLAEPSPILIPLLSNERPKDIIYKGTIVNYTGEIILSTKNMYGITMETWIHEAHKAILRGETPCSQDFKVRCTTFAKLIKKYPNFINASFLSIDVDGNEKEILSGINFDEFKPSLIIIEYKKRNFDYHIIWEGFLKNYKLVKETYTSLFYKRRTNEV